MCHCETCIERKNEIYPVEEKEAGHQNENTPCSSDFWRGVVCKPGAVKVEDTHTCGAYTAAEQWTHFSSQ